MLTPDTLVDRFIPESSKRNLELYEKAKIVVTFSIMTPFFAPITAIIFYWMGLPLGLNLFVLGSGMLSLLTLALVRAGVSLLVQGNVFCVIVYLTIIVLTYYTGGIASPVIPFFAALPILAAYVSGRRSGLLWAVLCAGACFAFFQAGRTGLRLPTLLSPHAMSLGRIAGVIILMLNLWNQVAAYQRVRDEIFKLSESRARELEKLNQKIVAQQNQLVTTSKMAALGEMAGGVAHEINNPTAIILAYTGHLRKMAATDTVDKQRMIDAADQMTKAAQRIGRITQSLLSFSREGGSDPMVPIQARSLIDSVLILCSQKLEKDGIQVKVELDSEQLAVNCRPVEIEQTFLNLLMNSHDALSSLPERWIKIEGSQTDGLVRIAFTDSGPGIPEALRDKVFDPFFTTKAIGSGTGLGLSVSKGVIEKHGGRIYLDPASPNTRFVIELPKA
jgi:signal transduction histidine kinase